MLQHLKQKSHNSRTQKSELHQWALQMHKTVTTRPPNQFCKLPSKTKNKQIFPTKAQNFTKKKTFIIIKDAREMCNGSRTMDDEILLVDDCRSP